MKISKQRFEAFTDGVIAIIITIMVLSIPLPKELSIAGLKELVGSIVVYLLSYIVVGAFWSQHHKLLNYVTHVNQRVVWNNFLFLFFLSLIPIFTKWVIENPGRFMPAICYDIAYLLSNLCYMFIFRYVMTNTEHDVIKKIKEARKEQQHEFDNNNYWLRAIVTTSVITALIILSIIFPIFSTFIMIGIPVFFSIVNLVFFDIKHKHQAE